MWSNILLIVIIVGLSSFLGLCAYFYYTKVYLAKPVQPVQIPVVNFEQDIVFLQYLIKFKIDMYRKFILSPMSETRSSVLTDDITDELQEEIIEAIYTSLSKSYKKTLSKYFTEEALLRYITEFVMSELTALVVEQNYNNIKRRNADSLATMIINKQMNK